MRAAACHAHRAVCCAANGVASVAAVWARERLALHPRLLRVGRGRRSRVDCVVPAPAPWSSMAGECGGGRPLTSERVGGDGKRAASVANRPRTPSNQALAPPPPSRTRTPVRSQDSTQPGAFHSHTCPRPCPCPGAERGHATACEPKAPSIARAGVRRGYAPLLHRKGLCRVVRPSVVAAPTCESPRMCAPCASTGIVTPHPSTRQLGSRRVARRGASAGVRACGPAKPCQVPRLIGPVPPVWPSPGSVPPQWWSHESRKMLCCGWISRLARTCTAPP